MLAHRLTTNRPFYQNPALWLVLLIIMTPVWNTAHASRQLVRYTRRLSHGQNESAAQMWTELRAINQDRSAPLAIVYEAVPAYADLDPTTQRPWMISLMAGAALSGVPTLNSARPILGPIVSGAIGYGFDPLLIRDAPGASETEPFTIVTVRIDAASVTFDEPVP